MERGLADSFAVFFYPARRKRTGALTGGKKLKKALTILFMSFWAKMHLLSRYLSLGQKPTSDDGVLLFSKSFSPTGNEWL